MSLKSQFLIFGLGTLCVTTLHAVSYADSNTNAVILSSQLHTKSGHTGALSGGGIASVKDISALDSNPAGLAQNHEVTLDGSMGWSDSNLHYVELGVMDSMMSEVSAGLKVRQTTRITGGKDRRFTLGLAQRLDGTPLSFGIAGEYAMVESLKTDDSNDLKTLQDDIKRGNHVRLRFGITYAASPILQFGFRSDGYLDKTSGLSHGAGLAFLVAEHYMFNGDVLFTNNSVEGYTAGMTLAAHPYMDILTSYAYEPETKSHRGGGGVVVKSQKARLTYAATKYFATDGAWQHQAGITFVLGL